MTCHLSPHQRHSHLYNVTRLLYISGQSLTFFSIVTDEDLRISICFHCYVRECSKNLPSPTYAIAMSLYRIIDSSRVVLSVPNTSGTDYINASFVDVSDACYSIVTS